MYTSTCTRWRILAVSSGVSSRARETSDRARHRHPLIKAPDGALLISTGRSNTDTYHCYEPHTAALGVALRQPHVALPLYAWGTGVAAQPPFATPRSTRL